MELLVLSGGLSCCGAADELKLQAFAAAHLQATAGFGGDDHGRSGQLGLLRGWQTADDEAKPATVLMLPLVPAVWGTDEERRPLAGAAAYLQRLAVRWARRMFPKALAAALIVLVLTLTAVSRMPIPMLMLRLRLLIAGAEAAAAECLDVRC